MTARAAAIALGALACCGFGILPPAECDHQPAAGTYIEVEVDNPNAVCRQVMPPVFLGGYRACSINGMLRRGTKDKHLQILYLPRREATPDFDEVRRHEWGHVNCGAWHG